MNQASDPGDLLMSSLAVSLETITSNPEKYEAFKKFVVETNQLLDTTNEKSLTQPQMFVKEILRQVPINVFLETLESQYKQNQV